MLNIVKTKQQLSLIGIVNEVIQWNKWTFQLSLFQT